jgi:hypothetical protein
MAVVVLLSGLTSTPTLAVPAQLSETDISDRLTKISAEYDTVGDVLSPEDSEFVKAHASVTAPTPLGTVSRSLTKQGSGAGGSGNINGYMKTTIGPGVLDNSYSFNVNASGSGRVTKTRACGEIRAYGAVGAGGVGVVFSDTLCNTVNGTGQQLNRGRSFTAPSAYMTITVYTDFYTSSGSFRVQS